MQAILTNSIFNVNLKINRGFWELPFMARYDNVFKIKKGE